MSRKIGAAAVCLLIAVGMLTACGAGGIVGSWGFSTDSGGVLSILIFDFNEDGTGALYYEFEPVDPTDPDSVGRAIQLQRGMQDERDTFAYALDGDTLTLTYAENDTEVYTVRRVGRRLTLSDADGKSLTLEQR